MAYQTALTIESVIKDIDAKKYLLPSIQREFVWSPKQIEKLFDKCIFVLESSQGKSKRI